MTTCAEWTERLAEAETALHQLRIGKKVEQLRYADKQTVYTTANLPDLERYVLMLQGKVDACNGVRPARMRRITVIPH